MRNFLSFLVATLLLATISANSQSYVMQRTITDPDFGKVIQTKTTDEIPEIETGWETGGSERNLEINWQFTDPAAIGSVVKVSQEAGLTYLAWTLNNERASLYGSSSTPIWETPIMTDFDFPIDMTPDGAFIAVGFGNTMRVYEVATQTQLWEKVTNAAVRGIKIDAAGEKVYTLENSPGGQDISSVAAYEVGNDDALWRTEFQGTGVCFAASGDRSRLAVGQYPGPNTLWVLDGNDGAILFDAFYRNQNPPAFSHDGSVLVSGDYSGYAYVYEYDDNTGSYFEKWNFTVGGGGTSAWVVGMDVSADGSTIAIGTLVFLAGGNYDGEVYLFNTYSPEPLWVFENAGDQVGAISISADGSLIAAAGYGPMDNSKPDMYLFRKESNEPIFTLSTPGSFNDVHLSPCGMFCSVTGKAVHARIMGSGGLLYNINANPGGGTIAGNVVLDGAETFDNVKVSVHDINDYFAYTDEAGYYEIRFVPEGTYTVEATRVGYYPVEQSDVTITEGETSTVNFTMTPTGDPPVNLIATRGAGLTVLLSWQHDDPSLTSGFNVYRKTIAEAQFPEEPIATTGSAEFEFEDEDIKPLTTYYYAVTASLDEGAQSPYSNVAEGWMASGFVVNEISAYIGTTPAIDGTLSPGEWDDAFEMDASDFFGTYDANPNPVGSVTMYFKVNEAMTELYVACIDRNKTMLQDNFTVALYIDGNNDGSFPPAGDNSEGNYWARYFASGNIIAYRPIYNTGGVGDVFNLENPQVAASDASGFVVMELVIPMGDDEDWKINPNDLDQSGLFLFTTGFDAYWPALNQQIFYPMDYGTITFGAEDDVPPPPDIVDITWDNYMAPVMITMEWTQPPINDFDHFRVYIDEGTGFELLTETIGTQVFYLTDNTDYTIFHVTTVDKAGQESEPSEEMIFDITTQVPEINLSGNLSVYPNPATESVTISFDVKNDGLYEIAVYDITGKQVRNIHSGFLQSGNYVFRWTGADNQGKQQKPGIYILTVAGGDKIMVEKIMMLK
jgi:WD40 repeat protein